MRFLNWIFIAVLCFMAQESHGGTCTVIREDANTPAKKKVTSGEWVYCDSKKSNSITASSCGNGEIVFDGNDLFICNQGALGGDGSFTLYAGFKQIPECHTTNNFKHTIKVCEPGAKGDCGKDGPYKVYFNLANSVKVDKTGWCKVSEKTKPEQTNTQKKIAGTCNYKVGDGITQRNYYLSQGEKVIPCNIPNDDNTCVTGDVVIFVNAPMACVENGWQNVDTVSLDPNCDESNFNGYEKVSTDVATFYYRIEKGSAKIKDLHGCAKKQPTSKNESQALANKSVVARQTCKIGDKNYTVGVDKKQGTNYFVCKADADCNNANLPNATELRCSGAKGDTCGSCIAEKCKENFTVKRVDGRNFGFCISQAEQNCIDAVGDKKWNSKTKKCDCGEKTWDDATNTCKEAENEISNEQEPPAQPVTTTCDENKGLKQSESNLQECVCIEDGAEYNKEKDRCEETEAGLVKVEIGDEHDKEMEEKDEPEYIDDEEEQRRQAEEEVRRKAEEERKKLEEARKKTEQEYKSARADEQSSANKALTAAAVVTGGLGGMEWASGRAEQLVDADAEREMSEYITTMKCEYGDGQQVDFGKEETLPGGNEMLSYYTEFKQLAENLKATKTALNLRPGIESEIVYDRAETGLYNYQTVESGGGANPSLSRALMNPDGADAEAWNAQKQESADKVQGGKTTASVGVIGGAVGNAAINTDVIKNVVENIGK